MDTKTSTGNSYLSGNFAPVRDELTVFDLPVRGRLPQELNGRLLRIGPNPIQIQDPVMYHWFLGDGMLHAIELRDGRAASYRNRWVRTDRAARALGEEPIPSQPDEPLGIEGPANTNVISHAGRILALVEVCLPTEVTPDLETLGRFDFNGRLRSPMTAHPKEDPVTGELLFFGYNPMAAPYLRFHVADPDGNLVKSEDLDIPGPSMIHDFAITENYAIFLDLPVVFDFPSLFGSRPFPATWRDDYGARVGVMPRTGTGADVRWYDVEPCYVFHVLNAYEDGGRIVLDVVRYPRMFDDRDLYGPAESQPTLDRWTIDPVAGRVTEQRLDEQGQEFPRVNDAVIGRRHRYGYGTDLAVDETGFGLRGIVKHDLEAGVTVRRDLGAGRSSSEPVFVQTGQGQGEDDGYLLSVVYDRATDSSELHVIHAQDVLGDPAAVVELPRRVPFGFHGDWVPNT